MVKNLLAVSCFLVTSFFMAAAQETETPATPQPKVNPEKKDATHKPRIGLGAGIFTYFGEVRDNSFSHLFTSSLGYELTVSRNISKSFGVDIRVIYGNLSVNERGAGNNYNFKSTIWNGSANIVYNFSGLYKKPRVIQPFVSAGFAYLSFDSKTDLYSAAGIQYHYWNDGTIRDMEETAANAENAVILQRDYEYETDLREQNLDGLGKYKLSAISVPLGAGFNIKVSDRFGMKLATTYFLNFTDLIDNISEAGEGARKGNSANDNFMFTSLSFSYALWSEEPFSARSTKSKDIEKYNLPKDYYNNAEFEDVSELDKAAPAAPVKSNYTQPTDEEFEAMKPYNRKGINNEVMQAEGSGGEKGGKYTVQVGAYGRNVPQEVQKKIDEIPGVTQSKINDSITIFTVGSYEKFEDAEKLQNQLIQQGLNDAFGLKENKVKEVTAKLDKLIKSNPELKAQYKNTLGADVLTFKVQTEEYRGEFDIKKFKDVIAQYGMQMQTTTGGLNIYTFGSFDNYNDANNLMQELSKKGVQKLKVKSYLNDKPISVEDALEFFEKD
jgi:hypothetical protein